MPLNFTVAVLEIKFIEIAQLGNYVLINFGIRAILALISRLTAC